MEKEKDHSIIGYIFAIGFQILFLYLANRFWHLIPFLTQEFVVLLWIFNITTVFGIICNIIRIFNVGLINRILQVLENILAFLFFYIALVIFPFRLFNPFDTLLKIGIIVLLIILVITAIFHFIKIFKPSN